MARACLALLALVALAAAAAPANNSVREWVSTDPLCGSVSRILHGTWYYGNCSSLAPYPDPFTAPFPDSVTAGAAGGNATFQLFHGGQCNGTQYSTISFRLEECMKGPFGTFVIYELAALPSA
eukprot:TRINITY_DN50353_c0_g1_i1.p2 TRINITY_DN50353_c0_g1~~TRINITY_DN50353_c0_g1_i1.p2  ORF type:complete len:123 (+),score=42.98 TRINITY_DN50353_c0_g1_i1:70-438(+)